MHAYSMSHVISKGVPTAVLNKSTRTNQWTSRIVGRSSSCVHCQHCLQSIKSRRQKRFERSFRTLAAVDDSIATDGDVDDLEEESPVAETDTEPAAGSDGAEAPKAPSRYEDKSEYKLNFLWMDKNVGVAVDQVFSKDMRSPVTEYYFWPRKDAWEELKLGIESKPWIGYRDKVTMLNTTTEVINFWQTEGKRPSAAEAREKFPDCFFRGQ